MIGRAVPNTPHSPHTHHHAGFTLIELLVTTSLLAMLMLAVTSMFMTFLISNARTNSMQILKGEGAYAISRIEYLIRNAKSIDSTCNQAGATLPIIQFKAVNPSEAFGATTVTSEISRDNVSSQLYFQMNADEGTSREYLTSTSIRATDLDITCTTSANSEQGRIVEVKFVLEKDVPAVSSSPELSELIEEFRTVIQVRN